MKDGEEEVEEEGEGREVNDSIHTSLISTPVLHLLQIPTDQTGWTCSAENMFIITTHNAHHGYVPCFLKLHNLPQCFEEVIWNYYLVQSTQWDHSSVEILNKEGEEHTNAR